MNGIKISRNVRMPDQSWTRISLEEGEAMEVIGQVRMVNTSLMKVCLEDAEKMGKLSPTNRVRVALGLFNKIGLHSFTAYKQELDCKADAVRDEARKANRKG